MGIVIFLLHYIPEGNVLFFTSLQDHLRKYDELFKMKLPTALHLKWLKLAPPTTLKCSLNVCASVIISKLHNFKEPKITS